LNKLGVLKNSEGESKKGDDEAYFYHDEDFDDTDNKSKGKSEENVKCGSAEWSLDNRKQGLRYLNNVTKEAQQEQHLKSLLTNGTPPEAPRLWEGAVGGEGPTVRGSSRGSKKGSLMSSRDGGLQASATGVMV
jgi:hypothetical protein